ncbi:fibrinogen C domain-containing protein 1-like, partial [Patiria miniata]|uniref:Fibrinogen C-terminal domain-containing protein n=1 Tax=Patiria miniata TaxID=46514 RepID=A0A913Z769_PATMI
PSLQFFILLCFTEYFPKDCLGYLESGEISGVYIIKPVGSNASIQVYCDMDTDNGGWTVFQRRKDGSVDFYRDFASYREGFGEPDREFWLGNNNLHYLTSQGNYQLRVDLSDFENNTAYAVYDSFSIASASDNYRLSVGGYSGTAGDSLMYHNEQEFTTKDRDNDPYSTLQCAEFRQGAWWYNSCAYSNLNGKYLGDVQRKEGITWREWKNDLSSFKTSEMKIRLNE